MLDTDTLYADMVFRHCLQFDPSETSFVRTATHHFSCAHVAIRPAAEAIRTAETCGWFLCTQAWFFGIPMGQPTLLRGSPAAPPRGGISQSGWQRMMLVLHNTAIIRGAAEAWQQIDGATDRWSSAWHVVQCRARAQRGCSAGRVSQSQKETGDHREPQKAARVSRFAEKPACMLNCAWAPREGQLRPQLAQSARDYQ